VIFVNRNIEFRRMKMTIGDELPLMIMAAHPYRTRTVTECMMRMWTKYFRYAILCAKHGSDGDL